MATIPVNPDWFNYNGPILNRFEPFPVLTGTAFSSANTSYVFNACVLPAAVAVKNFNVINSLNASVPGATSQASTGSEGYTAAFTVGIFKREGFGTNNSTNLSYVTSFEAGFSATLGYSSTSQQFGLSWLTDASGGTSAYTTTSNNGNWSSYATGPKLLQVPITPVTLSAGEYFLAQRMSTASGTSNSNVTLLSVSRLVIVPQYVTVGTLGGSSTVGSSQQIGIGYGVASAITTDATMPASVIISNGWNYVYQNLSNA